MRYFPVHLDLNCLPVLVVGGGVIAERRARALVDAGAIVRLVSPSCTDGVAEMAESGIIEYQRREFEANDLDGFAMVIGATDSKAANKAVATAARTRALLCNIVDRPALSNFIVPALVTRGDLQISIATNGRSPSLTQRVKREVAALIGEEYGELLKLAADLRTRVHQHTTDYEERRKLLCSFVESDALNLLRSGRRDEAVALAEEMLSKFLTKR
ncbi:MAG TPA: bifunctional precorrin-2 dehydrogenase/sirohydrochlorin ferrochelatase [Blastocatellia bacterium]|nr:bifunctional precorrin-2 dehydrogenase/sirohydrochlorin ferrochelatase [Blastocatellia bacterium]